ncbi:MAG: hypothetical protein DCC71_03105 [Proteobacteria bacterium]|nr:MAG: hypothetical protein DCC71_03105 [Pseudomonadota bacterium]
MRSIDAGVAEPGRNCWRLVRADRAAFLIDASSYFAVLGHALCRARHSIFIIGWDLHSRVRLGRRGARPDEPDESCELAALLADLARWRPRLRIRLLDWDYSMLMASEREARPWVALDQETPRQVCFRLDGRHPVGGSHHQKIVVIDDALAFVGGLDLTASRWDTPEHLAEDPRRVDPDGKPYAPFHDVQLAVDGEAAAALGVLARVRWERAAGRRALRFPMPRRRASDPWPPSLEPDFRDVPVAIARTEAAYLGRREVHEVERLYLDTIAAARRWIYVENQYLSSRAIGDALCERLAEPDGPEVVVVGPRECAGWLEETTMAPLRHRVVQRLREADRGDRFRLLYPRIPGEARVNVHSKLLIADDAVLRAGSANLSNRSMGLDTECDLQIEARGDAAASRGIARARARLLAEHLGVSVEQVETVLAETGSLIATIERLGGGERTLAPLDAEIPPWIEQLVPEEMLGDPERPIQVLRAIERWTPEELRDPHRRALRPVAAGVGLAVLLALAWQLPPLAASVQPAALRAWLADLAAMPFGGPVAVIGLFVATTLVAIPPAFPAAAIFLVFGGAKAVAYSAAGIAASAAVGYGLGRVLLRRPLQRLSGPRLAELRRKLTMPGVLALAALRLVPIAPFLVVNLLAGAARISFGGYMAGTLLGLAPLVAALALVDSIGRALEVSTLVSAALFGATIAALALFYALERRLAPRVRRRTSRADSESPPKAAGTA